MPDVGVDLLSLIYIFSSLPSTRPFGSSLAHRNSKVKASSRESNLMMGDPLGSSLVSSQKQNREGSGSSKPYMCESIPMMGDPLGSSSVNFQKQNREGVVGAQSGQYRVTAKSSPGCSEGPGWDVTHSLSINTIICS
ncbi:hypothetical protein DVH24_007292 [Malus domestica]|uniref:Uncharacterized protein n=1 Tax=Malus domestica TaxID=3750 RepID=A0A498HEY8_MALDO|nr:hypothetical protein DVH24_007292 [Malus domestica]